MVNSITGIGSIQQPQAVKNAGAKLQAVIASIVSGQAQGDVASLSLASQLQSQTSGLKQISGNIAQGLSQTQVADGGAAQIQNALGQLESLARQAQNPTLNDGNRAQLNEQFQKTLATIDQIAKNTSFNGKPLLDGSLSGDGALSLNSLLGGNAGDETLSIGSLASGSILNGKIDILSADNAGQSLTALSQALNQVTSARTSIGSFESALGFASANVDSAIVNQEAALSTLSETDIADASSQGSLADIQRNASIALEAQGNRLSPALLKLVG